MSATKHVVVVGGGAGGLSAAIELAAAGVRVTLLEARRESGGVAGRHEDQGFRFDVGPSTLAMPEVVRGVIARGGRRVEELFQLEPVDPQWRCFHGDGRVMDLPRDHGAFAADLAWRFPKSGSREGYAEFLATAGRMLRLAEAGLFRRDCGSLHEAALARDRALMREALSLRLQGTSGALVEKLVAEPRVREVCLHMLRHGGDDPRHMPAFSAWLAAAQAEQGLWLPRGDAGAGVWVVARALEHVARGMGVEILTATTAKRLTVDGKRVTAAVLESGRLIVADGFVCDVSPGRVHREFIGVARALKVQEEIAGHCVPTCSAYVLMLGLTRRFEQLARENVLFSADSARELDDVFDQGIPARDPTLHVTAGSVGDAGAAPTGGEALRVVARVPYLRPQHAWGTHGSIPGETARDYRLVVLQRLERAGLANVERFIKVERAITPADFERTYGAEHGSVYGWCARGRGKGGDRIRCTSEAFENLWFAGASTTPGGGLAGALMSGATAGREAAERVL